MSKYPTLDFSAHPNLAVASKADHLNYTAAAVALNDADQTLATAELLTGGLDANAYTGDHIVTLPTAALLVAGTAGFVGTTLEFFVVTNATDDCDVAAGAGGVVLGVTAVDGGSSAQFSVRLTNVSSGSEAYQVIRLA